MIQSPYVTFISTTADGSVAAADLGGLCLAAVAITAGGTAQLTLTATSSPGGTSYGSVLMTHPATGVGTAVRLGVVGTVASLLLSPPIGPLYGVRATAVGTNLAGGTVVFYARG